MLDSFMRYLELGMGSLMVLLFLASPFVLVWCLWSIRKESLRMAQWRWDRGIYTKWEARRAKWKALVQSLWRGLWMHKRGKAGNAVALRPYS